MAKENLMNQEHKASTPAYRDGWDRTFGNKEEKIEQGQEPENSQIKEYMKANKEESYYSAREKLREKVYGGKPPDGFSSWGAYWKCY